MAFCGRCGTHLRDENIDRQRELGTCGKCGNLIDLRSLRGAAPPTSPVAAAPRQEVALPRGVTVAQSGGSLVITRAWWRTKHIVMIPIIGVAVVWLVMQWVDAIGAGNMPPGYVLAATPFILVWDFMLTLMFVSKTRVVVGDGRIDVKTTPLALAKNGSIPIAQLSQLFAVKQGPVFGVMAELASGTVLPLLTRIKIAEHALFIEQRIEAALGMADRAVTGELPKDGSGAQDYVSVSGSLPLGEAPAQQRGNVPQPKPDGRVGFFLLIPFGIVTFAVVSAVYAFTSGVEGALRAHGDLGNWVFEPNDCVNGQTVGFYGIELRSEKDTNRRVRLLKDELNKPKIAILAEGAEPVVIGPSECPGMKLDIVRTNDVTNNVYLMEGNVALDCPRLKGSVKYERCGL